MIEHLSQLTPDSARSERTRARCRKALIRQARPRGAGRLRIERAIFLCLSAIYLSFLALDVAQVLRW
jgi:hypothetical protein